MKPSIDYISQNKAAWDTKTEFHIDSAFYDNKGFLAGKNTLNSIELDLLGDVKDKTILHLQCHFGQDSLSLARMGATVTGIDFSEKAIEKARDLNQQLNLNANFHCCELYECANYLNAPFDLVFTSYGTIGWLPDLNNWAKIITNALKPGGRFIMADFHPVVWMMDSAFSEIKYSYFNAEDIIETETGSYADKSAPIEYTTVSWNHSLSELLNALIQNGLEIALFNEYDYSPYPCFNGMEERTKGQFQIQHLGDKIPLVYALVAFKK